MGFSGDVMWLDWQCLAYQPYFSMTATNVAYGFWSHDLEGPGNDYGELHWGEIEAMKCERDLLQCGESING